MKCSLLPHFFILFNMTNVLNGQIVNKESPEETRGIETLAGAISETVEERFSNDEEGSARRDAHPKATGCARAEFRLNAKLPIEWQTPLFQPGKSYPAFIRYSNATGAVRPDEIPDARGMAVKLFDISGTTLINPDNRHHDFIFASDNKFFLNSLSEYFGFLGNRDEFLGNNPDILANIREATSFVLSSPLEKQYFSQVPYKLNDRVVKYSVKPCQAFGPGVVPENAGPDYLSNAMNRKLKTEEACFNFMVQFYVNDEVTPINNVMVAWNESEAPFIKVGQIIIPRQNTQSEKMLELCENVSYNPFHAIAEHEPIGAINRIRRVVYQSIASLRRSLNQVPDFVMTSSDLPEPVGPTCNID